LNIRDDEYLNILDYGTPTGTISIRPHPEDVIDVEPEVIARMKARLEGKDLSDIYSAADRNFDEVSLLREKKKLKKIFSTESDLRLAFSSIKNIKIILEELAFEDINRPLLAEYSFMKSRESNVDEFDFYRSLIFDAELINKEVRANKAGFEPDFETVVDDYKSRHFDILKVTKEAIHMSPALTRLFGERKLASAFDEFLFRFYGAKI
jgi:hypothetical protein